MPPFPQLEIAFRMAGTSSVEAELPASGVQGAREWMAVSVLEGRALSRDAVLSRIDRVLRRGIIATKTSNQ